MTKSRWEFLRRRPARTATVAAVVVAVALAIPFLPNREGRADRAAGDDRAAPAVASPSWPAEPPIPAGQPPTGSGPLPAEVAGYGGGCAPTRTRAPMGLFPVDPVPGLTTGWQFEVCPNYRSVSLGVESPEAGAFGSVVAYAPGAFDPTGAKRGEKISVRGRVGYFSNRTGEVTPLIAWEYAPDAWAAVRVGDTAPRVTRTQMLAVAAAAHPERTVAQPVPFRLGHLPSGLVRQLVSGSLLRGGRPNWITVGASFADPAHPARKDCRSVRDCGTALEVGVQYRERPVGNGPGGEPVDVDGTEGDFYDDDRGLTLSVHLGTWDVTVQADPNIGLDREDLAEIARNLTLTTAPTDLSVWFDARTAVP